MSALSLLRFPHLARYCLLTLGLACSAPPLLAQPAPAEAAGLVAALDWALQENQREGSAYFGRIDPAQLAFDIAYANGMDDFERIGHVPNEIARFLRSGLFQVGSLVASSLIGDQKSKLTPSV